MNGSVMMTASASAAAPQTAKPPPPIGPAAATTGESKNKVEPAQINIVAMYESLKNSIAAPEEEEQEQEQEKQEEEEEEEEERLFAEEAQKHVHGLEENAVHVKYIELFVEFKRMERKHQKEKQKLLKDKDAAKSHLTQAMKMENPARELQMDNKRLRAKMQDLNSRLSPDIVVKVVCRYRAELYFKILRKTKLVKLFTAWTDRMETSGAGGGGGKQAGEPNSDLNVAPSPSLSPSFSGPKFIFRHGGRQLDAEQTPEEVDIKDGDEILAVELIDYLIYEFE